MKNCPFPGSRWITDELLVANAPELTPAMLGQLLATGVHCVVHLVSKEQFLAAGSDALFGPLADALEEVRPCASRRVGQKYCFWPLGEEALPTVRQVRSALDAIDDANRAGSAVFVHGGGSASAALIVTACWLARHGQGKRGQVELEHSSTGVVSAAGQTALNARQWALVSSWKKGD